jgi:hypothetical protein
VRGKRGGKERKSEREKGSDNRRKKGETKEEKEEIQHREVGEK